MEISYVILIGVLSPLTNLLISILKELPIHDFIFKYNSYISDKCKEKTIQMQ